MRILGKCRDGSPGGYYLRTHNTKGEPADPKKWIIFAQGGGWCSSDENCAERARSKLGSSKFWGPTYTDTYEGSEMFKMKPFDSYTVVYAMYCDGQCVLAALTPRQSCSHNTTMSIQVEVGPAMLLRLM